MFEDMINKIHLGDCMEVMKQMPDKCVDLVLTDPPYYKIVNKEWDRQWKTLQDFQAWVGTIGAEIKRIMKDNASFYWFGDDKNIAYCQIELDKYFNLLNNLVWRKTPVMVKGINFNRSYTPVTERILFYDKGERFTGLEMLYSSVECFNSIKSYMREEKAKIKQAHGFTTEKQFNNFINGVTNTKSIVSRHYFTDSQWCFPTAEIYKKLQTTGYFKREYEALRQEYEALRRPWQSAPDAYDVLRFLVQSAGRIHETQKPVDLIAYLIERSSHPAAIVFDPFSGSGTTAVACHKLNRRFICVEKDPDYHQASVKRLKKEQKQLMMF